MNTVATAYIYLCLCFYFMRFILSFSATISSICAVQFEVLKSRKTVAIGGIKNLN